MITKRPCLERVNPYELMAVICRGRDGAAERFRHPQSLTARELNVILTWASGGTPIGSADTTPAAVELVAAGAQPPDVAPLPEFTMPIDKQEDTVESTLATARLSRWLEPQMAASMPAIARCSIMV
jgi:hypothetical protein